MCLPNYSLACVLAYSLICLPTCLPRWLFNLIAHLLACFLACLPACPPACSCGKVCACLLACLPACLFASLLALACLLAMLLYEEHVYKVFQPPARSTAVTRKDMYMSYLQLAQRIDRHVHATEVSGHPHRGHRWHRLVREHND